MNKNVILKATALIVTAIGAYKLWKYCAAKEEEMAKEEEAKQKEVDDHRAVVLKGIDYAKVASKTLDNDKIKPEDRAEIYAIYKRKLDAVLNAKTIAGIDSAKKKFDEFTDIWLTTDYGENTAEIISGYLRAEKEKAEVARTDDQMASNRKLELEKYKLLANAFTRSVDTISDTARKMYSTYKTGSTFSWT